VGSAAGACRGKMDARFPKRNRFSDKGMRKIEKTLEHIPIRPFIMMRWRQSVA
jgi:hypothetical protein